MQQPGAQGVLRSIGFMVCGVEGLATPVLGEAVADMPDNAPGSSHIRAAPRLIDALSVAHAVWIGFRSGRHGARNRTTMRRQHGSVP